jgi:UTP--glucose-1-phosphate uridylyltransferase
MGRYVITPDVFDVLEATEPGSGGEIQLTDALRTLSRQNGMYALELAGQRYDVGDKLGFLKATCEFALRRDDLKEEFSAYLKDLTRRLP